MGKTYKNLKDYQGNYDKIEKSQNKKRDRRKEKEMWFKIMTDKDN